MNSITVILLITIIVIDIIALIEWSSYYKSIIAGLLANPTHPNRQYVTMCLTAYIPQIIIVALSFYIGPVFCLVTLYLMLTFLLAGLITLHHTETNAKKKALMNHWVGADLMSMSLDEICNLKVTKG